MDRNYTKVDFEELINFDWESYKNFCRVDDDGIWLLKRNAPELRGLSYDVRDLFLVHPDRNANMPVLPFPFSIAEFLKFSALPAFDMRAHYTFADKTIAVEAIEKLEQVHTPAWELARALMFGVLPTHVSPKARQGVAANNGAKPVVTGGSGGDVEPTKYARSWTLKPSIERAPGYRWPLYQFLKTAYVAGETRPKARDVLAAWALKPPPDVQVMPDGLKYDDSLGNPQEADLKAIQQAIRNLMK